MVPRLTDLPMDALVEAAGAGSADAWSELVGRFQDMAVATALGWSGSLDGAQDVAQDAFCLAFRHLDDLADPRAFPAWFARLVRTACHRRRRRWKLDAEPLDAIDFAVARQPDPATVVLQRAEVERVRAAVEALPPPERVVVALHHLADMPYAAVAAFLGISTAAAKKRAQRARCRLKELMPIAADMLAASRPSRDRRFRDTILLFDAIRRRDLDAVGRLIGDDPSLVRAHEDWTPSEAFESGLPYAGHATPLIRAAGSGDVRLVRMLVEAGAEANGACLCAGAETPLWTATLAGAAGVVRFLLEQGADPNAPAFQGATPLHVAVQRGRHDLVRLLLAHGADPDGADRGGRVPADWSERDGAHSSQGMDGSRLLPTGIRVIDLFAPLHRGCLQRWHAGYGLGQLVVIGEVARALAPAECWWIGFTQPLLDEPEVRHVTAELGVGGAVRLVPRQADPASARVMFGRVLEELASGHLAPRLVVCLEAPGHALDVALALPVLAAERGVLATLVVDPFTSELPSPPPEPPEGYHGQVVFDPVRGSRHLYPAIDPLRTVSRSHPSDRHAGLAATARGLLAGYMRADPELAMHPQPGADAGPAVNAQRLIRYLAQPLVVAEPFTSRPGQSTAYEELMEAVGAMVAGEAGDLSSSSDR